MGPEFGVSVKPIPTRGADYAHHITACQTGFENLAASLVGNAGTLKWVSFTREFEFFLKLTTKIPVNIKTFNLNIEF